MFVLFIIPVSIAIVIVAAVVVVRKEKNKKDTQQRTTTDSYTSRSSSSTSTGKTAMTDEQRRRLEYLRQQQKAKPQVDKHELHVQDAKEHAHAGEEEHYEEIVGSLGEVNDEGCGDLGGVRFIVHDLAYETGDEGEHDYAELAKAMVLGEIINTPRFKGLKRP